MSDVDRLIERVYVALNSGRDKAVVQVVIDETDALRREVEGLRAALNFKDGTIEDLAALIEGLRDMNCGCVG